MAKLTKQEVGGLCGIATRNVAVYISRDKLNVNESGEIDDQDPKNRLFIEKYARKKATKAIKNGVPESDTGQQSAPLIKPVTTTQKDTSDYVVTLFEKLEKQKLELQSQELEGKVLKLKLTNEKMLGNFIPTPQVKLLILQLSESIHLSWENELEDVLLRISSTHNLSREETAEIKKEKITTANGARLKSIQTAKTMLRRLIHDISEKRGVGEHG